MNVKKSEQEILKQSRLFICEECKYECALIFKDCDNNIIISSPPENCVKGFGTLCKWTELEGK